MLKRILYITAFSLLMVSNTYALSLGDTINETLKNNPEILIPEKDHQAIQEALKQSKSAYWPQLKANLGYGIDNSRNGNTVGTLNPSITMPKRQADLTLNQMIFDGFATSSDVERNNARVNSAVYKVIASIQDTVQKNIEVYVGVLKEEELVQLVQENLAFHERITHMITLRTKSGVSRRADLYQAQGRLALARSNLLAEYSNLADAKANFFRTIGIPADDLIPPPQPDARYLPANLRQAEEIGMKNNPVIKSANADIYAAIAQHNVAKAGDYPKLELQVGVDRDRNVGGQRDPSFENFALLNMTYTIFDGGAITSKKDETAYQELEAREIQQRAMRQLIESIKLTWDLYTTSLDQIPLLIAHVDQSEKTVDAYAEQYQLGQRTLLDLLDSQNELFAAKRAYVSGKYDLLQSKYRLLRDMGISIVALHLEDNLPTTSYSNAARNIDLGPQQMLSASQYHEPSMPMSVRQHVFKMPTESATMYQPAATTTNTDSIITHPPVVKKPSPSSTFTQPLSRGLAETTALPAKVKQNLSRTTAIATKVKQNYTKMPSLYAEKKHRPAKIHLAGASSLSAKSKHHVTRLSSLSVKTKHHLAGKKIMTADKKKHYVGNKKLARKTKHNQLDVVRAKPIVSAGSDANT